MYYTVILKRMLKSDFFPYWGFKVKMMFKECVQVPLYIIITIHSNKHMLFYECEYNFPCKVLILFQNYGNI